MTVVMLSARSRFSQQHIVCYPPFPPQSRQQGLTFTQDFIPVRRALTVLFMWSRALVLSTLSVCMHTRLATPTIAVAGASAVYGGKRPDLLQVREFDRRPVAGAAAGKHLCRRDRRGRVRVRGSIGRAAAARVCSRATLTHTLTLNHTLTLTQTHTLTLILTLTLTVTLIPTQALTLTLILTLTQSRWSCPRMRMLVTHVTLGTHSYAIVWSSGPARRL